MQYFDCQTVQYKETVYKKGIFAKTILLITISFQVDNVKNW